jgi:hypothetical protein
VLAIEALAKKCALANNHIEQWQAQGKQICFVAPIDSFRQPVPDSAVKLTPIGALQELFHLCQLFNLPVAQLHFPELDTYVDQHGANIHQANESIGQHGGVASNGPVTIEADIQDEDYQASNDIENIAFTSTFAFKMLMAVLFGLVVLGVYLGALHDEGSASLDESTGQNINQELIGNSINRTAPAFALVATLSANKVACASAQAGVVSSGFIEARSAAEGVNLRHLCSLDLITGKNIANVWMVTDTKAIFVLSADLLSSKRISEVLNKQNILSQHRNKSSYPSQEMITKWALPLPQNQSQTRKYTLLAFRQKSDEADLSSLNSYLLQLHKQNTTHTRDDLQLWIDKTQINNSVSMLKHELTLPK